MASRQQQAFATAPLNRMPRDLQQPNARGVPEPAAAAHARRLTFIVQCFALAVGIASVLVLTGWLLGVPWLCRLGTAYAMAPNTSLAFLSAAGSLWLAARRGSPPPRRRASGLVLASAVLLLGAVTGMQYVSGVDFHVDQLLAVDVMLPPHGER